VNQVKKKFKKQGTQKEFAWEETQKKKQPAAGEQTLRNRVMFEERGFEEKT